MRREPRAAALLVALTTLATLAPAVRAQAAPSTPAAPLPLTVIHAGTLLAEPPAAPKARQTVLVRGDRIVAIREGFVPAAEFAASGEPAPELIDLSRHFVLPGLIDGHVHLSFQSGGSPTLACRSRPAAVTATSRARARTSGRTARRASPASAGTKAAAATRCVRRSSAART